MIPLTRSPPQRSVGGINAREAIGLRLGLEAPAFVTGLDDIAVMGEAVEERVGLITIKRRGQGKTNLYVIKFVVQKRRRAGDKRG